MNGVAAQQSYGLAAPSSRQDVVSALLSAYGSSFEHSEVSPSTFSPVQAEKELPPPPPRSDSLRNKPLPAVQRAEQRMSMKFQLRVIEDAPPSPRDPRDDSPETRSRKKILYRSLSRGAKPPSLNLVTSNGSTAIVPPTPSLPIRAQTAPVPSGLEAKGLPSPPPPPPEKSTRRSNVQQPPVGLHQSKSQTDLARNDSLLSQGETKPPQSERPSTVDAGAVVKRKALPAIAAARKFKSLAELGTGPRGGKGGPLPPTSAPRKKSVDNQASRTSQQEASEPKERVSEAYQENFQRDRPTLNELPPTPEEDKPLIVAPVPPRKAVTAIGLPSNPRARGGAPISPKHVRGKSSTGFSLLKAQRPAPPVPTKQIETLTPEMTPSPTLKPEVPADQVISPLSPLPEQRRPFSFEPGRAPTPPSKSEHRPLRTEPAIVEAKTPEPYAQTTKPPPPPRADSLVQSTSQSTQQPSQPPTKSTTTPPVPTSPDEPHTPPPFTPLTRQPIPLPATLIPAITSAHMKCYTSHATSIWSNNAFQPMGCMVCHENARDRKWSCTWCRLRVCVRCSEELKAVGGRLRVLLEERRLREEMKEVDEEAEEGGMRSVVVDEDGDGDGYDFA